MGNHTAIIDGNSMGHAAHRATKLHSAGMETQAAFGMIRSIADLRRSTPTATPLVLWDGKADWRYAIHPDYKSNRNSDAKKMAEREAYKKQRPFIARLLQHLGVRQMTAFKHEADDMAGYLVPRLLAADPTAQIDLVTGDGDWAQLVRRTPEGGRVHWMDHRSDKLITPENFYDKTGCKTPFAYLETKILVGDGSDCIPGVGGIGEKGAPEFIAEFGSVRNFWQLVDSGKHVPKAKAHRLLAGNCPHTLDEWMSQYDGDPTDEKAKKKFAETWPGQGRKAYKRNFQLMQLLRVAPPAKADVSVIPGKLDREAFAAVCEELAFTSILRKLDSFIEPFKQ